MADGKPGAPKGHPKHGGMVARVKNKPTKEREQRIAESLSPDEIALYQRCGGSPKVCTALAVRAVHPTHADEVDLRDRAAGEGSNEWGAAGTRESFNSVLDFCNGL